MTFISSFLHSFSLSLDCILFIQYFIQLISQSRKLIWLIHFAWLIYIFFRLICWLNNAQTFIPWTWKIAHNQRPQQPTGMEGGFPPLALVIFFPSFFPQMCKIKTSSLPYSLHLPLHTEATHKSLRILHNIYVLFPIGAFRIPRAASFLDTEF
jgi:hypothetical protein